MSESSDKRAIVTGASSGIGRETARQLAAAGWRVLAVGRRAQRLDALKDEHPRMIVPFAADVGVQGAAETIIEAAGDQLGGLDLLVNNAGIAWIGSFDAMPDEQIDRTMNVNVLALMRLCRAAIAPLERSSRAQIINVASVAATIPMETIAVYCASKAAVLMFTRVLARELKDKGIRVNALSPAGVNTEIFDGSATDPSNFMPPADVAAMLVDLTRLPASVDCIERIVEQRGQPIM